MGGAVSAGVNNDDLIDNLIEAKYIQSPKIAEIFRAVDRGNYFLPENRDSAYHDLAWRHDHLHISAPCIYSKVMSALNLQPGLSFLNIGSGTGYLSTMVGLVLGIFGINHGIELHQDVVDYANKKTEEFTLESRCFDRYTFCEPQFVTGNCLHISPDSPGYDRIYCGAACPVEYESFMKNLLNINGLLVMPLNDQLQVIKRTGQAKWEASNILVVNFATLVVPDSSIKQEVVVLPSRSPPPLYVLCRACIRQVVSAKYHHGSNRRFKKKTLSTLLTLSPALPPDTESDSDAEPAEERNEYPADVPPRQSAILNVLSGTMTTVFSEGTAPAQTNSDEPSSSTPQSNSGNSPESGIPDKNHDDDNEDQPSTSKSKKKKKSTKNKNSGGNETNGKAKRARRGWALIRRRFRKRFSSDKSSSSSSSKHEQPTSSDQPQSSSVEEDSAPVASRPASSSTEHVPSTLAPQNPRAAVRSLLFSMANSSNRSLDGEVDRRLHRNLVNLFNSRRSGRNTAARLTRLESNSDDPDPDSDPDYKGGVSMQEIPLPPNHFQSAILELPLPPAVKQFLLFYRTPN